MNDKQLECFILVATHLSFRKAAEQLYITQPGVSHLIKALETELGFPLFERKQNRVFLTRAGELFYREAMPAFTSIRDAAERARNVALEQNEKRLVFCCSHMPPEPMSALLLAHAQSNTQYELSLLTNAYIAPTAVLKSAAADLAICMREDLPNEDIYSFVTIRRLQDYCVISKSHPLAPLPDIGFLDLRNQTIVQPRIENVSLVFAKLMENITENVPSVRLRFFDDHAYMLATVQSGGGIWIDPLEAPGLPKYQGLTAIPFRDGGAYTLGLCYLRRNESPELTHLIELVLRVF